MKAAPKLVEIRLSKTTKDGGAGLRIGPTYLALIDGEFWVGVFDKQWYGLNFEPQWGQGRQSNPPTENGSGWQRVWRIDNAPAIKKEAELDYAKKHKAFAMANGLKVAGKLVTKETPLEAFFYDPPDPPKRDDDEDEDREFEAEWDEDDGYDD